MQSYNTILYCANISTKNFIKICYFHFKQLILRLLRARFFIFLYLILIELRFISLLILPLIIIHSPTLIFLYFSIQTSSHHSHFNLKKAGELLIVSVSSPAFHIFLADYSTVTDLARLRGMSTFFPLLIAM